MGVVFGGLLLLGVGCVVLDTARNRRHGASLLEVLKEVGHQPSDWQLVAAGLGFVAAAFATTLTDWAAGGGVLVLAFLGRFLHQHAPRRTTLPRPTEVLAVPEPASNVRVH